MLKIALVLGKNVLFGLKKGISGWMSKIAPKHTAFQCCQASTQTCWFILISYSLYTQLMLPLTFFGVQYLENVVFSFEKGLKSQSNSSDSHHLITPFPSKISHSVSHWGNPPTLKTIWKTVDTLHGFWVPVSRCL